MLDGRDQPDLAVQASEVEPVDVLSDSDLEVVDALPPPGARFAAILSPLSPNPRRCWPPDSSTPGVGDESCVRGKGYEVEKGL